MSRVGDPLIETGFRLAELPRMRSLIESTAIAAGLTPSRAEEAVLAVNEVATNALLHGGPPAALRVWVDDEELTYEISDRGTGIEDVLAGAQRPSATQIGGRGLWITRQLCDDVEITNDEGCTVTLRVATPSASLVR
jgi:anti-sigma regulatory factor (Ser/Thr protein kinase)